MHFSMKLWSQILTASVCCLMSVACQTRGTEDLATSLPVSTVLEDISAPGERIAALDIITVSVFGAPDLGGDYQVDFEGKLKLPLIGEVEAKGLTPLTLAGNIENRYEENYLQSAEVTVLMKEAREQFVTVDGSVGAPGQYAIKGKTTLMQAVALAGGADEFANLKRVVVFREIKNTRHVAGFSLNKIRDGTQPDPELRRGDIVIVDGNSARRDYRDLVGAVPILALFRPF